MVEGEIMQCTMHPDVECRRKGDIKWYMKNKWRQETFNKRFKLQKWQEKRQKTALRNYYKQLRKEDPGRDYVHPADKRRVNNQRNASVPRSLEHPENTNVEDSHNSDRSPKKYKPSAFKRALLEFEQKHLEKKAEMKVAEQRQNEKQERLKQYKKQRTENFKKLSLKTARGQPVMAGRIHMLLNIIERDLGSTVHIS